MIHVRTFVEKQFVAYHTDKPAIDGYAFAAHESGTESKKREFPRASIAAVIVNSPFRPRSSVFSDDLQKMCLMVLVVSILL